MDQAELNARLAKTKDAANALSEALNADVIFFNGDLSYWTSKYFVEQCRKRGANRKNAAVVIITSGGDADAAYRIIRHLQTKFTAGEIYAIVPGQCKSAGTLIVCGSHKIYMGDFGELGPLDVQFIKRDELWEAKSGLNVDEAVRALENIADKMFEGYLSKIKKRFRSVRFRTAADLSISLIEKLLGPIAAQIDPQEIGENSRAMDVTKNYATRLDKVSRNFKNADSITFLVESYPDHNFVIDITEAKNIFKEVHPFTEEMRTLEAELADLAREPIDWSMGIDGEPFEVKILSDKPSQPAAAQPTEDVAVDGSAESARDNSEASGNSGGGAS
jgi:hypothetical protein